MKKIPKTPIPRPAAELPAIETPPAFEGVSKHELAENERAGIRGHVLVKGKRIPIRKDEDAA